MRALLSGRSQNSFRYLTNCITSYCLAAFAETSWQKANEMRYWHIYTDYTQRLIAIARSLHGPAEFQPRLSGVGDCDLPDDYKSQKCFKHEAVQRPEHCAEERLAPGSPNPGDF